MQSLIKTALVGTDRHPPIVLDEDGDLHGCIEQLHVKDQAELLLLLAGAQAIYQQAGQNAVSHVPQAELAVQNERVLQSPRLIQLLTEVLKKQDHDLLAEFLRVMKHEQLVMPYVVLPLALNTTDPEIRQLLVPVIGERGRWLSRMNPRWEWVQRGSSSISAEDRSALQRAWDEGKLAQRALALSVIRRAEPAEGRRWLEVVLPQEKADARAELVEQLQHGLDAEDEPLLESLLADRSDQVRQLAASLLRQLPGSQLLQRMTERASAMLHSQSGKLVIAPVEELSDDCQRDGVSSKAPSGRGKRGYWLESIVSMVPLEHWVRQTGKQPEQLMAALNADPYLPDLIQGWTRAIEHERVDNASRLAWTHALWNYWMLRWQQDKKRNHEVLNKLAVLLRLLPPSTAEKNVLPFLVPGRIDHGALTLLLEVLPRPWSSSFASHYLQLARQVVSTGVVDESYEWGKSLEIAARSIPTSQFASALAPWPEVRQEKKSWTASALAQLVERFCDVVKLRLMFYEALPAKRKNR